MPTSVPSSPTTRRTHQRLVEATRAEVAANGSFTAERVAARAGTSPATFYSYFPTKTDALGAAFDSVMTDLVAFAARELSIERLLDVGLETRCAEIAEAAAAFFAEHTQIFRIAMATLPESRPLRDVFREHEEAALAIHVRFVELGQRAGQVRAGDAAAIAQGLLVLTQGINNGVVLRGEPGDPLRRQLGTALFAYLSPSPPTPA